MARGEVGFTFGFFEGDERLVAHAGGVFDGFESRGELLPLVIAEVRSTRTRGDDQRVVGQGTAVGQNELAVGGVQADGFVEQHAGVLLAREHGAQRGGDFARRKRSGGHLIQQRLKEVEVAAVHHGELNVGALQGLGGIEAAKAATQNHDAMRHLHAPPVFERLGHGHFVGEFKVAADRDAHGDTGNGDAERLQQA